MPLIYTPEDAKKTVNFCKFPPRGQRGFGSPFTMQNFSNNPSITEYLQEANDSLVTIVQIETMEALESVSGPGILLGANHEHVVAELF